MTNIELEHPEYAQRRAMWKKYRDLYSGGEQIKSRGSDYLTRRQKEPLDVYAERLDKVFYENHIGSIIDWYAATVFRREPSLSADGADERAQTFFAEFSDDCDTKGTSLTAMFRKQLVEALIQGVSYVLVDFPRASEQPSNRADEEALGITRAYLVDYTAENIINWELDSRGNYSWVVIRQSGLRRQRLEDPKLMRETRWIYFDKENFRVYRKLDEGTATYQPEFHESGIELVDEGRHALADQQRVPLFEIKTSEGLWLMNKAALLQLEHFNKSNALSWALTMGLFATPVIYSERPWDQVVGESYYIQLGPQDRFGWTEPEGKVYQIAADNLRSLQEEIYRVCYLLSQAGSSAGAQTQSGLSKQRDFTITQEVMRAFGDQIKDTMRKILRAIAAARGDTAIIDVSGLDDFDINDFSADLSDAERLLKLGIPSQTLTRLIQKRLANKYLCDVRQNLKDQIGREIDGGGTPGA